jgi:hypothetical protein
MAIHFSDLYLIAGLLNQMSEQEAEHNTARARLAWNMSQKVRGEAENWEKFWQVNTNKKEDTAQ